MYVGVMILRLWTKTKDYIKLKKVQKRKTAWGTWHVYLQHTQNQKKKKREWINYAKVFILLLFRDVKSK